ncbi:MAG: LPP20 family lipoprotein [Flavobacteriales bacterium]|nr:LPP20 family lipoprotein [Flavobacteriales bacterium]
MRAFVITAFLALIGCKDKQPAVVTTIPDPAMQRPQWVTTRPSSTAYYVGIGLASKSRPDVQEAAKKNALNDLASEISVTVEGNSLLYTLDQRSRFDESFTSTIKTSTSEQLEGYELVDSWENGNEYWTYYRLSKAEHARIKEERKARALGIAKDLHSRAASSIASGDLRAAFDQDLRALIGMKAYWGENDLVEVDGRQVPLVNELYADLQKFTSGVRFNILPERCELTYDDRFKRELLVSARYEQDGLTRDLVQLPVAISYPGTGGKVTELKNTDADGHVRTTVQRVATDLPTAPEVVVRLNIDELVSKELEPPLVKALLSSLTVPEKHAAIDMRMPKVYMRARETNLGDPVGDAGAAVPIREELTRNGFRFVDREQDADMVLSLNSSTRQGGESNGFFTSFLDITYSFRDRRSQDVINEGGRQGVKGVQLNYQKAGLEAYKKAVQELRKELVPAMMSSIHQ